MFNLFRTFVPEMTTKGMKVYRFKPILKQTIWGGDKIAALKHLSDAPDHLGESWEVSGVEDNVSVVADGPYADFTTHILDLDGTRQLNLADLDSFLLVMVLDGSGILQADDEPSLPIRAGETLLLATTTASLTVSGQMKLVTASIA